MLPPTTAPRRRVKLKQRSPRSTRAGGRRTQRVLVAALLAVGLGAPATLLLRAVVRDGLADPANIARRFQVGDPATDKSPLLRLPTAPAALPAAPATAPATAARATGWSTPAPDAPVSRSWETPYANGNGRITTNINPSAPLAAVPVNPALPAAGRNVGLVPATPPSPGTPSAPVGLHALSATAPASNSLVASAAPAAALTGAAAVESALHPVAVALETSAASANVGPRSRLSDPVVNVAPAADTVWQGPLAGDTPSPTSNWTDNRNWNNGAPVNDGTADVAFGAARSTTGSVVNANYSINSLVFQPGASAYNVNNGGGNSDLFIGAGGIHNDGANTQTLAVEIFATANQTIAANSGQLDLQGAAPSPSQAPAALYLLGSNRTVTIEGAGTTNISGIVREGGVVIGGSLVKSGTGTLILAGDNSFTGGVTLNSGTLELNNGNALGTGTFTVNGGTVSNVAFTTIPNAIVLNGTLDRGAFSPNDLTFSGPVNLGAATRTVNASNSGGGLFTLSGVISGTAADAGVNFTHTIDSTSVFFLEGPDSNTYTGTTTVDAVTVALRKSGAVAIPGNLTVQNNGFVSATGGQLAATTNLTVNTGGRFDAVTGGFSDSANETFASLNGDATGTVTFGNQFTATTLTVGQGNFAGLLQDESNIKDRTVPGNQAKGGAQALLATSGGELVKSGAGTLTLSGNNTYSGGTVVTAGTLLATNVPDMETRSSATGVGPLLVLNGALLGGTGTVGSLAVDNGEGGSLPGGDVVIGGTLGRTREAIANLAPTPGVGILSPGVNGIGTLTINGNLTLTDTALLDLELGATASDRLLVGGAIALGGDLSLTLVDGFSFTVGQTFFILDGTGPGATSGAFANVIADPLNPNAGTFIADNGNVFRVNYADSDPSDPGLTPGNDVSVQFLAVPEPGTWALLAFGGLAGIGAAGRRRRQVAA